MPYFFTMYVNDVNWVNYVCYNGSLLKRNDGILVYHLSKAEWKNLNLALLSSILLQK